LSEVNALYRVPFWLLVLIAVLLITGIWLRMSDVCCMFRWHQEITVLTVNLPWLPSCQRGRRRPRKEVKKLQSVRKELLKRCCKHCCNWLVALMQLSYQQTRALTVCSSSISCSHSLPVNRITRCIHIWWVINKPLVKQSVCMISAQVSSLPCQLRRILYHTSHDEWWQATHQDSLIAPSNHSAVC